MRTTERPFLVSVTKTLDRNWVTSENDIAQQQYHRSQSKEFQTKQRDLSIWVTCSVNRDVTFIGYPLLSELEPEYPLGLTVMFRDRRLVQLTYVLASDSLELLLPNIIEKCGVPSKEIADSAGRLSSVSWTFGHAVLLIEKTPINSEVYEGAFVRVTKATDRFAVTALIYLNDSVVSSSRTSRPSLVRNNDVVICHPPRSTRASQSLTRHRRKAKTELGATSFVIPQSFAF